MKFDSTNALNINIKAVHINIRITGGIERDQIGLKVNLELKLIIMVYRVL